MKEKFDFSASSYSNFPARFIEQTFFFFVSTACSDTLKQDILALYEQSQKRKLEPRSMYVPLVPSNSLCKYAMHFGQNRFIR